MFRDPNYDLLVVEPAFIDTQVENLSLPIEKVDNELLKTFSDEYTERYQNYFAAKQKKHSNSFKAAIRSSRSIRE
ncbi:MAG: fatty acid cis/trans isomerase [Campylobacterales bacterium]|nr:fatty acid cis/trans isomerase [Campylobacterales bacterium]